MISNQQSAMVQMKAKTKSASFSNHLIAHHILLRAVLQHYTKLKKNQNLASSVVEIISSLGYLMRQKFRH